MYIHMYCSLLPTYSYLLAPRVYYDVFVAKTETGHIYQTRVFVHYVKCAALEWKWSAHTKNRFLSPLSFHRGGAGLTRTSSQPHLLSQQSSRFFFSNWEIFICANASYLFTTGWRWWWWWSEFLPQIKQHVCDSCNRNFLMELPLKNFYTDDD